MLPVVNKEEGWIGYRLNILGIRVWRDKCQLSARSGDEWMTLGAPRTLPVEVPRDTDELAQAADDPLLTMAFQYVAERPGTDLADVLAQRKKFDDALSARPSGKCS